MSASCEAARREVTEETPDEATVRQHLRARRRSLKWRIAFAVFNCTAPVLATLGMLANGTPDGREWTAAPFGFLCGGLALAGWRSLLDLREAWADLARFERYALMVFERERKEVPSDE